MLSPPFLTGRERSCLKDGSIVVELKSVGRKLLDISFSSG